MKIEIAPAQEWWTAEELAAAALPDMPASKRRINMLADDAGWRNGARVRRRAGRGGGWEYNWKLLPRRAQMRLIALGREAPAPAAPGADWAAYERLPDKAKAQARERLEAVIAVEALIDSGATATYAVEVVAGMRGCSERSLWGWRKLVDHVERSDRLPLLAPRHRTAARRKDFAEITPEAWEWFKAAYLRPSHPTLQDVYRDLIDLREKYGWSIPSEKTIARKLKREVSPGVIALRRFGRRALDRLYPPQVRDKTALRAMEVVNADYHTWDVFVRWNGEIVRPLMCAFQDIYSGKILSWRLDLTANVLGVQLAFGDMVEEFGIPEHCVLDNGREFAAKWFTGGAPTRFRFKVKEDDLEGTLPLMGVQVHWATPYRGQSKPIERTFRDLCSSAAKDLRFDGAWTGNRPDAKPEDYASRAIDIETFTAVIAERIAKHNARTGRRSAVCAGGSFDEAFAASYTRSEIRKATDEQRRFWLMGAEQLRADSTTGALKFEGNTYWSVWMNSHAGQRLVGRFDPADLHAGLHVYAEDGRYLGHAECHEPVGFLDLDGARKLAKAKRAVARATRDLADAYISMSTAEAAAMLDALPKPETATPEAKVVRPASWTPADLKRAPGRPAPREFTDLERAAQAALVADFESHRAARAQKSETRDDRYERCTDVLVRVAAGEAVDPEDRSWAEVYRGSSEFRAVDALRKTFGGAFFGAAEN